MVNGVKHTYVYTSGKLLRETYGDTTIDFFYSNSGQPYALKHNGTVYYYITNVQGDVMSIVDGTGAVVVSYKYDPYGNILSTTGTLADTLGVTNPLRYRGYVYDSECNLYYLQSRYYDPSTGRFLNADSYPSTGQGILGNNMFAYCGNNPVKRVDVEGYFWETVWDIVSLGFSVAEVIQNPDDPMAWVGLAGDVIDVAVPFVGGLGEATKVTASTYRVVDNIHDTTKALDNTGDLVDTAGDVARRTDFYVAPTGDIIPASKSGFDYNLSQMELRGSKYYGYDYNQYPVRVRVEQHAATPGYTGPDNPYHTAPHFHIDRKTNGKTGEYRKIGTWLLEELY